MKIDDAIRTGFRVLFLHPSGVFPFYLFEASILLIIRVPLFIGLILAFVILLGTGQITPVIREIQELNTEQLVSIAVDPSRLQGLADALAGLVTPVTITITVLSLFSALVVWLIARGVAAAGTLHAVYAAPSDREALSAGVNGIARDTLRFIGLQLVQAGLILLVSLPLIYIFATYNSASDAYLVLGYGILWVLAVIAISIALLFAGQAIVIDDVGPLTAVRRSLRFLRFQTRAAVAYIGIIILVIILAAIVWWVTGVLSISQIFVLFLALAFRPYLDTVKTGLYAEDIDLDTPMRGSVQPIRRSMAAFRNGWTQVVRFVVRHPSTNIVSLGILILGFVIGWIAVSGFNANLSPTTDVRNVFGSFPIDVFVELAVHNWYVAANEVFAGIAFALPTIMSLLLNGFIIGVIGGVIAPVPFVALVLPHGIIELPALAVAGGVGLHLGRVVWNGVRRRTTIDEVANEIGQAYHILLGLALLFVIAAFIEAFITPWIGSVVIETAG